MGQFVNAFSL